MKWNFDFWREIVHTRHEKKWHEVILRMQEMPCSEPIYDLNSWTTPLRGELTKTKIGSLADNEALIRFSIIMSTQFMILTFSPGQAQYVCFFLVPVFRVQCISPHPKERFTFNDKYYFGSFITVAPNNTHMLTSRTINKEFMADDKNWHKQINVINPFYGYVFAFFPVAATKRKHIEKKRQEKKP